MPIFFGWGKQTIEEIRVKSKRLCAHCHNEGFWVVQKITTWFTLFFVPIIPYSVKYFFSCPICKYGLDLNATQFENVKNTSWIGETESIFSPGTIEKEIITCDNCKQKIRVPKDRQRYVNITCSYCKESPFLSLSDRFHKSTKINKLLWIGGAILLVSLLIYGVFRDVDPVASTEVQKINNNVVSPVNIQTNIVSFSNGEFLNRNPYYLSGSGELEITNGTNNEAVAKLVNTLTNKSVATVYIEANNNYTLKNISDGSYKLVFNLGHDWDTISKKFTRNSYYSVFEDNFNYTTRSDYEGEYYDRFRVTLNPVMGGTAKTTDLNPSEFTEY